MRNRDRAASKTLLWNRLIFYISLPLRPPKDAALGFGGEGNQYAHSGPGRLYNQAIEPPYLELLRMFSLPQASSISRYRYKLEF
jgi:hypothetical protein